MKQLANRHFFTLVRRETERFVALYKQTVMPGLISTALYISGNLPSLNSMSTTAPIIDEIFPCLLIYLLYYPSKAFAPLTISIISVVIAA